MKKILRVLFTCITAISSAAIARQDPVAFIFAEQSPYSGIIKKNDFLYVLERVMHFSSSPGSKLNGETPPLPKRCNG